MEIWDAYNDKLEKLDGMTLVRGEEKSIPKGVYHLVCDILVRHTDGTYLLMQRDKRKSYPLCWEASAGGSALKGETPMDCALRELKEETGITAEKLEELTRIVRDETHSFYVEYLCVTDCDKDSVVLQEGETVAYKWIGAKEILEMPEDVFISNRIKPYIREGERL